MSFIIGKKTLTDNRVCVIRDDGDLDGMYVHLSNDGRGRGKDRLFFSDDTKLEPVNRNKETERLYVAGPTGSGKSTYCSQYIRNYLKENKGHRFFIFSAVNEDEVLDVFNPIRIVLDEEMMEPIDPELLRNSLCLFDDIDSIPNAKIKKTVQDLRDSLITRGRHENITTLSTSHLLSNYKETRVILNECSGITFFPKSGNAFAIDSVLKKYCGLNKNQIQEILNLDSRWVTVYKNYPMFVMSEHCVYLLK